MPGPSSIAVRLGLSPSTVSHHLARLQHRGLVERRPYFGNRRWRDVELTPAGREAYETLRDARHEALASLVEDWSPAEKRQLADVIGRLGNAVRLHNLDVHDRRLAKAREASARRSPEQIEQAKAYQRERYERERYPASGASSQRDQRIGRRDGASEEAVWPPP